MTETPKKTTPEKAKASTPEKTALAPAAAKTAALLSPENKGIFSKMSKGAKEMVNEVYAELYKFSAVKWLDRGVKKMEIAYHQLGMEGYEKQSVEFKTEMDGLKMQADQLEASKEQIKAAQQELIRLDAPGTESLELQIKGIDKEKSKLLNKADQIQSKFEASDNSMKLYANKRDKVASNLISDYSEKLKPMEKELAGLEAYKNQMNLRNAVTEVKHKKETVRLENIEKKKTEIETALKNAGMSPREIKKSVRVLDEMLVSGRNKIMVEQETIAQQMSKINMKIAKVDAKANPYRDKREQFVRVKDGRPIKIEAPARARGKEFKGAEEIRSNARGERTESAEEENKKSVKRSEGSSAETESGMELGSLISKWNVHLQEKFGDAAAGEIIDQRAFLNEVRSAGITGITDNYKLDLPGFKSILGAYYDVKKMPRDKFWGGMTDFEKKLKAEKKQV